MTDHREPFQTLTEQQREQMRSLLDLLTAEPDATGTQVHDKIRALGELDLLLAVHTANNAHTVHRLIAGEIEQIRSDLHTLHEPLAIMLERITVRLADIDKRQVALSQRQDGCEGRLNRLAGRVVLHEVVAAVVVIQFCVWAAILWLL